MAVTFTALSPYQDPAFLAYLRASGVEESDVNGEAMWRVGAIQRARGRKLPRYDDQLERGQESIGNEYEDRGLLASGSRVVAQQRQANDVARDRADYLAEGDEDIAGVYRGAAQDVAGIRRRTMEEELDARNRVGLAGAEAGIR